MNAKGKERLREGGKEGPGRPTRLPGLLCDRLLFPTITCYYQYQWLLCPAIGPLAPACARNPLRLRLPPAPSSFAARRLFAFGLAFPPSNPIRGSPWLSFVRACEKTVCRIAVVVVVVVVVVACAHHEFVAHFPVSVFLSL